MPERPHPPSGQAHAVCLSKIEIHLPKMPQAVHRRIETPLPGRCKKQGTRERGNKGPREQGTKNAGRLCQCALCCGRSNPANPASSANPANPANSANPASSANPANPANSANSANPANSANSANSANPANSATLYKRSAIAVPHQVAARPRIRLPAAYSEASAKAPERMVESVSHS